MNDEPPGIDQPEKRKRRMDLESIGRVLLLLGAGTAIFGGLLMLLSRIPVFNQLFNLPGDIRIETSGFSCLFPIVTMIILSVLLTVIANIIIRFLNR